MRGEHEPALIITDGGLTGLIACWTEGVCSPSPSPPADPPASPPSSPAPVAWFPSVGAPAAEDRRLDAARRQAELCHLGELVIAEIPCSPDTLPPELAHAHHLSTLLLAAATEAAARGLARVVWPVHLGLPGGGDLPGLEQLAAVCDRALLIGQLVSLSCPSLPGGSLRIETPYIDFADWQMMDLALDLDAPLAAAWWCEDEDSPDGGSTGRASSPPCGGCAPCRRWSAAMERVRSRSVPGAGEPGVSLASPDVTLTIGPRPRKGA